MRRFLAICICAFTLLCFSSQAQAGHHVLGQLTECNGTCTNGVCSLCGGTCDDGNLNVKSEPPLNSVAGHQGIPQTPPAEDDGTGTGALFVALLLLAIRLQI